MTTKTRPLKTSVWRPINRIRTFFNLSFPRVDSLLSCQESPWTDYCRCIFLQVNHAIASLCRPLLPLHQSQPLQLPPPSRITTRFVRIRPYVDWRITTASATRDASSVNAEMNRIRGIVQVRTSRIAEYCCLQIALLQRPSFCSRDFGKVDLGIANLMSSKPSVNAGQCRTTC